MGTYWRDKPKPHYTTAFHCDDMEAEADALMRANGIRFGQLAEVYTEEQINRLTRQRGEVSADSLGDMFERLYADKPWTAYQEVLDRALDDLAAGSVTGIGNWEREVLTLLLQGWTMREIADVQHCSVGYVCNQIRAVRVKLAHNESVWIWLTLAEVFGLSAGQVRDMLR